MEGLITTLILGIFIILGAVIVFLTKNSQKFIDFSISLAFGVMGMLLFIDLIPEAFEVIEVGSILQNSFIIILGAATGFLFLHVLDHFIPDHDDDKYTTKDDDKNLKHIGLVSSIALVIHNIVEGMAIYLLITGNFKAGLMACIGVGLHNIPLGMVIASTFYKANNSKKKTLGIIFGVSLSTFVGGLIMYLFRFGNLLPVIEGIAITVTIGMLIYILFMELLPKILHISNKKVSILGITIGVITLLATLFI